MNDYLRVFGDPFPGLFKLVVTSFPSTINLLSIILYSESGRAYPDVAAQSFNVRVFVVIVHSGR